MLPQLYRHRWMGGDIDAFRHLARRELARAEVLAITAVHSIPAHGILDYGTDAQKARWLPQLASGRMLAGIALTEPGCGSDLKALRTRAVRSGDGKDGATAVQMAIDAFGGNWTPIH